MPRRHVIISAHNGVHARPVAELARVVQAHGRPVTVRTATGASADLSSVLAVMDLGLERGDAVTLETADTTDAASVLDALAEVLDPRS